MISLTRTRILVFVLVALALGLGGAHFFLRGEARLETLPANHGQPDPNLRPSIKTAPETETEIKPWPAAPPRTPCVGPRGLDLGPENDDNPREKAIDIRKCRRQLSFITCISNPSSISTPVCGLTRSLGFEPHLDDSR
jgi:hypothetical protein